MIKSERILNLLRSNEAALALSTVSACLFLIFPGSVLVSAFCVVVSVILLHCPASYLPLLAVSAISSSYAVFGVVAAVFWYSAMFLFSLLVRSRFHFSFRFGIPEMLIAAFFLWMAFSTMVSGSGTIYLVVRLAIFVAVLFLSVNTGSLHYRDCIDALVFAAPFIAFTALLKYLLAPELYMIEGTYLTTYRLTIVEDLNPNQLATVVAMLTTVSFIDGYEEKNPLAFLGTAICLLLLFAIKSRTAFYSTVAVCMLAFLFENRRLFLRRFSLLAALALIAGALSMCGKDEKESIDTKSLDLSSIVEDGASGRVFTWIDAFTDIIPSHPLSGIGFGKESYEKIGFDFDADNLYIDLMCELGIPGLLLFLCLMVSILRGISRTGEKIPLMLCILLFFYGIGETLFDAEKLWLIILIPLICIRTYEKVPE